MLKGLRLPFVALAVASGLLVLALVTQPDDSNSSDPTSTPEPTLPPTAAPVVAAALQSTPESSMPTPVPPPTVLVEALVGQIGKLNPLLATNNPVDQDIAALIFEGLTTTNEYGEVIPDLAESWRVTDNGLQYIFVLRQDVLWQDGIPFTAEDVVFTVELLSDPLFPGAESLHAFWSTVEVDALSETLVRFRLTQPLASFPDQLRIGLVPAHVLKGTPVQDLWRHPFNLAPIGTGPYQIETLTASEGQIDGIQLRVAPVYRQRPEGQDGYLLDRIVFRTYASAKKAIDAYLSGEVNSIGTVPHQRLADAYQLPGASLYTAVDSRVGVLIYNWKREDIRFVRNARARLALAHAIDRGALVSENLAGRAILADSPLLPNSWAYAPGTWPTYDVQQAQYMLDTANLVFEEEVAEPPPAEETETPPESEPAIEGIPDGNQTAGEETPSPDAGEAAEAPPEEEVTPAPPLRFALTILTLDDPALVGLAEGIAASWRQIGLEAGVDAVDAAHLHERLEAGDFDAALIELDFAPNADPDSYVFWHQGQYGTGQNYGGMDDRRVSEALEQARREPNSLNRLVYYREFQSLFAERVPALVLYYPLYTYAVDARLQGVQLGFMSSPSDRFRTIQDWRFEG
jgi:ABC-type transport system substrate-binding protein